MVRQKQKDPFWDFVDQLDDAGPLNCIFCGYEFAAATSISRIKWHLSGVKGRGVRICEQVPENVQDAARAVIDGPPEKKLKAVAGSRNNEVTNAISTSAQEQNNQVIPGEMTQGESLSPGAPAWIDSITDKGIELMHHAPQNTPRTELASQECEVRTCDFSSLCMEDNFITNDVENPAPGSVQHFERGSSHDWLSGDSSQQTDLLGLGLGRHYDQLRSSSLNNDIIMDDVENMTRAPVQPAARGSYGEGLQLIGAGASSSRGLTRNTNEIKGDALPIIKLVGQAFEDNKKTIWSWLMNDDVSSIGIYGMGGVGKTTLVAHLYSQLLKRPDTFSHVYWITLSQEFSINRLQNSIARYIDLDLSNEDEELNRAIKLSEELMKRQKWILILDDLWNSFEPHKVGIPVQVKGCKLILTTRSEKVCRLMDIRNKIKVKPLSKEEAWTLFIEKLGHGIALPPELRKIAQSITEECDGLPLGIITMARTMKGVDDVHEWRNASEDLKQSRVRQGDMEVEVFRILRFSYMHLKDSSLQQCFLYCALFPEDFEIPRQDLIAYLIDEGVVKGLKSRKPEFDKCHSMLNRLENVCLLESGKTYGDRRCVKMHDLIRDMAIQIQQKNFEVMVQAGAHLRELPDAEEWTENLVRVSLMGNQIEEIPSSHSPRCPSLSTLLLRHNGLRFIADSFFEQLHGLKALDLSYTYIEKLPDSVSDMVSLKSLLLKNCVKLRHVPSLKKLRTLKRLDLSDTAIENVPQGMECLSNLRYLRMNGCGEKEFPSGILPKLSSLQVLIIEYWLTENMLQ